MVRKWLASLFRKKNERLGSMEPVRLAERLREYPGLWVAIVGNQIVDARETPDRLVQALSERDISNATIIRAPQLNEPELVGLG